MLGNKIYFINSTKEIVEEGVIAGYSVNEQGHSVYSIYSSDGRIVVNFCSLSFETKEEAEKKLQKVVEMNKEIKRLQKETNKKIDDLLDELRGKPDYPDLIFEKSVA